MADKPPSLPVLTERVTTAVKLATWFALAALACAAYFEKKLYDNGVNISGIEGKLGEIEKKLDVMLDKQSKATLSAPQPDGARPEEIAEAASRAKERNLPISPAQIRRVAEPLFDDITPAKWEALKQLVNLGNYIVDKMTQVS
jgi:hypothetical protein